MFEEPERNTVAAPKGKWWPKALGVVLVLAGLGLAVYAWWGWQRLGI